MTDLSKANPELPIDTLDSLFAWFTRATIQGSLLALAVLVIQAALRGRMPACWRYALWLPVVFVCVSPRLPESRWSVENRFTSRIAHVQRTASPSAPDTALHGGRLLDELPPQIVQTPAPLTNWVRVAEVTWLMGTVGMLVFALAAYVRTMRRMRQGSVPADAALVAMLSETALASGLRRPPRVLVSMAVRSPAVTGFLRALLLLPAGFPCGFTREETRLVLLHELTHIKRHDLPLNWLLCLLHAIHWCNPALWFAFARIRADREAACDSQVLALSSEDRRADYGHALLKLEGGLAHTGLTLGFLGIFERNVGMHSRIRAIAAYRRGHPAWNLVAATLIVGLTVVGGTRAQNRGAADLGTGSGFRVKNLANPPAQDSGSFPEVKPVIGLEGYTIDLNLAPQVVEFEGFINYGSPIQTTSTNALGQQVVNVTTPNVINQPIFSTRKVPTSESVFDGQIVLGGLMREDVKKVEDKAPLFAEIPLNGRPQKPQSSGAEIVSSGATAEIHRKLNTIIIPRLELRQATIQEAVDFLRRRSVDLDTAEPDPGKRGVNIVLRLESTGGGVFVAPEVAPATRAIPGLEPVPGAAPSRAGSPAVDPRTARITISLTNIPLIEALRYVSSLANLNWRVAPTAVEVVPPSVAINALLTKEYKVTPDLGLKLGSDPKEFLIIGGVAFPSGASAALLRDGTRLVVRNTQENLDIVDALLAPSSDAPGSIDNPPAVANETRSGTEKIARKLNTIIFPRLAFRQATLREALEYLSRRSVELDTTESDAAKRGVNIVQRIDDKSAAAAGPSGESGSEARITISLTNVPLVEALKFVTELANCKFNVEPYAVLVMPRTATDVLLFNIWKLDEATASRLGLAGGIDAKDALRAKGVTFPPSAMAIWIPRSLRLTMRNTQENLNLVDALIVGTK